MSVDFFCATWRYGYPLYLCASLRVWFLSRLPDGRVFPHASRKCGRFCSDHFTVHIDDAILIIMLLLRFSESQLKFNQDVCSHDLVVSYAFPV